MAKVNAPDSESQRAYHQRRYQELKALRSPWLPLWRSLAEYVEPSRFRDENQKEGPISRDKIIDSSSTFAWKTLASGMHSGITSPARPWFRLTTFDHELRDYGPVKAYLSNVERRLREAFSKSNVYPSFHIGYGDIGLFGQSCALLVEDDDRLLRLMPLTTGTYCIARDDAGVATTLYRSITWSAQKIVKRFGIENVSTSIKEAYERGHYSQQFTFHHAIEPRLSRDPSKPDRRNKAWLSNYWEDGPHKDDGKMLEESGFDTNPIIAPPWELSNDETYSVSPAMVALGDVKMLQQMQMRKLEAIDKKVRPPMKGPLSMTEASLLPGALTLLDDPTGKAFGPAMEVNLQIAELAADISETSERIRQAFYADLFLMISQMEGIQPRNNFEIAERKEEKLLALGPVLENIYSAQLEPVIDRAFEILNARGELPPPPPELEGQELQIEYISILAQAQRAVSTGAIERVFAFAGNISAGDPAVLDKLDRDEAIDQYADALGVPPSIIVADDRVAEMRSERAEAEAMAANAQLANQMAPAISAGADAARVVSETADMPTGGGLLASLGIG